jgi:TPR repeat protein
MTDKPSIQMNCSRLTGGPRSSAGFSLKHIIVAVVAVSIRMLVAATVAILLSAAGDPSNVAEGLADFGRGAFAEAFQNWQKAYVVGDARGALYVGVLYDSGLGVTQDYRQAMAWYRRAAQAGSAAGAFNVAVLYDAGLGVPKDLSQAVNWYAQSAATGFGRAEYNLAMMYETGSGVPASRERAIALYLRAAADGIPAANVHLAALGRPSAVVTQKPQDPSMQYFQRAQQLLLGRGPGEAKLAADLFRRAAEQRNPLAEYDLGYCYEKGIGVSRDLEQADNWYRRAIGDASNSELRGIAEIAASNLESQRGGAASLRESGPNRQGVGN